MAKTPGVKAAARRVTRIFLMSFKEGLTESDILAILDLFCSLPYAPDSYIDMEIKSYAQEGEGELARGFTHSLVIDGINEYLDDPAYIAVMDEIMKPALKDFLFFDSFSVEHEEPPHCSADPRLETWHVSKFSKLQLRLREFAATPTVHLVGTSAATGGGCALGDATDFEESDAAGPVDAEANVEAKSMNK